MAILSDIIDDLYPNIHPFWVNGTVNAGAVVYISEADGISQCYNESYVPIGVALQDVGDNQRVSVVCPPTTVWLKLSSTTGVSAGKFIAPSTTSGYVVNASHNASYTSITRNCLVGVVEDFYPGNTNIVKTRLMCIPDNASRP